MKVEWVYGGDWGGSHSLWREFLWLLFNGSWCAGWNGKDLMFGGGRIWYDGPYWVLHLGVVSFSLGDARSPLKKCPFCDAEAQMVGVQIICQHCGAVVSFPICSTDTHTKRLWNRRPSVVSRLLAKPQKRS